MGRDPADGQGYRTAFVDVDTRPEPKTSIWCCRCQRDLKEPTLAVYLEDQMLAVHPEDLVQRGELPDDIGWHWIGSDCSSDVGAEYVINVSPELRERILGRSLLGQLPQP